ncbi:MAG: zinc ribbon domain-containing protein [Myxococcota bacterium]
MDFNRIFKYAWELFVKDIVPLIVGGLIAGILSVVTLGILAGPLYGGLTKMVIRRVRENRPAEIGDVFSAMDQFGTLFLTTLVIGIILIIGFALCIIPGLLLSTIWIYVIVLIVDKKLSMGEAMSGSKSLVMQVGFGMHLIMVLIFGLISGILSITYIGGLVASPFVLVVICVMYFLFNNEEHLLAKATSSVPSTLNNSTPFQESKQPSAVEQRVENPPVVTPVSPPSQPQAQQMHKTAMLVCAGCGNKGGSGAFCIECGAPLKLVCSNCKRELMAGARFCPSCGSKLE